jgi:hypothetical protein
MRASLLDNPLDNWIELFGLISTHQNSISKCSKGKKFIILFNDFEVSFLTEMIMKLVKFCFNYVVHG